MIRYALAVSGVLALCGACGTIPTPGPTPTPAVSESPTPTPSPTNDCLTGRFRVAGFAASGSGDAGRGGDLTATFGQGTFVLTGAGHDPVQVTISGTTAEALVTGSIRGTYTADGGSGTYTVPGSDGSADVSAGVLHRTVPMSEVAKILTPEGTGTVSCTGDQATMSSSASRLDLRR